MKKNLAFLTVSLVFLLFSTGYSFAQDNSTGKAPAKFLSLNGDIKHKAANAREYAVVEKVKALAMSIEPGDTILMPQGVTGEICFVYGARLDLSENTELQTGIFNIRIKKGDIWVNFKPEKNSEGKLTFKVLTPVGTIGIKGTRFSVGVDEKTGATLVSVTEGVVGFESNDNRGSCDITAGEFLKVSSGIPVGTPEKIKKGDSLPAGQPEKTGVETEPPVMIDHKSDGLN